MNTIKITLAESGRIAQLDKDFPLYQGSFQNKLLNVLVPKSIVAPILSVELVNGEGVVTGYTNEIATNVSVAVGMQYLARNGVLVNSENFYMRYVKIFTKNGVEYVLFERLLPSAFTLFAGQGENAPTLIVNVVNIKEDTETAQKEVLSVYTSQTCKLDVMPSSLLDKDEVVEPTEFESLNGRVTALEVSDNQQDIDIAGLETKVEYNSEAITKNEEDIAKNTQDIEELKNSALPEEYIGSLRGPDLPTPEELTQFVVDVASREPKNSDVIIFTQEIPDATDKNFKYIYGINGWDSYEIPLIETASNGTLGIVQGTFGIGDSGDTLVNIVGGKITDIYIKATDGSYENLATKFNLIADTQQAIIDGTQKIGFSEKAKRDQNGNIINEYYLDKTSGATKDFVRDYALPKTFNDVYYIATAGYVDKIPTTPPDGKQFSATSSSIGSIELFTISKVLDSEYSLSAKNSASNTLWVSANANCVVEFRLTTKAKKAADSDFTTLNVELSGTVSLIKDTISKVQFDGNFVSLGSDELDLTVGDTFEQTLEVVTTSSTTITFDVYSNSVYSSTFSLNIQGEPCNCDKDIVTSEQETGAFIHGENTLKDVMASVEVQSENLVDWKLGNISSNGITYTQNADGTFTANGTATSRSTAYIASAYPIKSGKYFFSGCPENSAGATYYITIDYRSPSGEYIQGFIAYTSGKILDLPKDGNLSIYITVQSGVTVNNLVFKPKFQAGTVATAYTPYLPAGTAVNFTACGKNLIPFPYPRLGGAGYTETKSGITATVQNDGGIRLQGTAQGNVYFQLYDVDFGSGSMTPSSPTNGTYVVSGDGVLYDGRDNFKIVSIEILDGATIDKVVYPQVEYGTVATAFELYQGQNYSSQVGQTVDVTQYDKVTNIFATTNGGAVSTQFLLSTKYELETKPVSLAGTFANRPTGTYPYVVIYTATDKQDATRTTRLEANTDGSVSSNWISICADTINATTLQGRSASDFANAFTKVAKNVTLGNSFASKAVIVDASTASQFSGKYCLVRGTVTLSNPPSGEPEARTVTAVIYMQTGATPALSSSAIKATDANNTVATAFVYWDNTAGTYSAWYTSAQGVTSVVVNEIVILF